MNFVNHLCTILVICTAASAQSELENRVQGELNILEDMIYFPINLAYAQMDEIFNNLIALAPQYNDAYQNAIVNRADNLTETIESISGQFTENEIDVATCQSEIYMKIDDIKNSTSSAVTNNTSQVLVEEYQKIVSNAKRVFDAVENKTVEIRLVVQDCVNLDDNEQCLLDALDSITLLRNTLPSVRWATRNQHIDELDLLEDKMIVELNDTYELLIRELGQVLDGFLVCVTYLLEV